MGSTTFHVQQQQLYIRLWILKDVFLYWMDLMKAFKDLTYRGKLRRFRTLAIEALTHYNLNVVKIQFISD